MYDYADAKEIFTKAQAFINQAPNEAVAVNFTVATLPPDPALPEFLHFKKVIMVLGLYAGDVNVGQSIIQPLRELATPIADQTAVMPFLQLQQKLDPMIPPRVNCYGTSLFLNELSEESLDAFLGYVDAPPAPGILVQLWSLGGKMNEIASDESPFAIRDAKWALLVDAMAMNGEDEACQAWIDEVYEGLLPFSHKNASYLNAICPASDVATNAFGQNLERLVRVKKQYDPTNAFRNNHTIEAE